MSAVNPYPSIFIIAGVFLCLEVIALLLYWLCKHRGISWLPLLANAGAGGCLLLAAWLSSINGSLLILGLAITGSFLFHMLDQALRWRS